MADITKCQDHGCPLKKKCYRYNAPASEYRQAYFIESPRKGKECDQYWDRFND